VDANGNARAAEALQMPDKRVLECNFVLAGLLLVLTLAVADAGKKVNRSLLQKLLSVF
jgi:hypothetical protein